jgi:WD40 repeat protein
MTSINTVRFIVCALILPFNQPFLFKSIDGRYFSSVISSKHNDGLHKQAKYSVVLKHKISGHADSRNFITFSIDGLKLLAGLTDRDAGVWDIVSGNLLFILKGAGKDESAAFSPNGQHIVTASTREITIWEADGKGISKKIKMPKRLFASDTIISFSKEGKFALVVDECRASVIDLALKKSIASVSARSRFVSLESGEYAFSPDGKTFVGACHGDSKIRLYDSKTGGALSSYSSHKQQYSGGLGGYYDTSGVLFSLDGNYLFCLNSFLIEVLDIATGEKKNVLNKHTSTIYSMKLSPDGNLLGTVGRDGRAIVWDWKNGTIQSMTKDNRNFVSHIAFSPDGKLIATGGKSFTVWETGTGRILFDSDNENRELSRLSFALNGQLLVCADDKKVTVWNVAGGKIVARLEQAKAPIAISPNGKTLATKGQDDNILLWELDGQ